LPGSVVLGLGRAEFGHTLRTQVVGSKLERRSGGDLEAAAEGDSNRVMVRPCFRSAAERP